MKLVEMDASRSDAVLLLYFCGRTTPPFNSRLFLQLTFTTKFTRQSSKLSNEANYIKLLSFDSFNYNLHSLLDENHLFYIYSIYKIVAKIR